LGQKSHAECLSIYKAADYLIHLAYMDHCPNVVIEALACNLPVICADSGGTKEIVKDSGIIIPENREYNFELFDFDEPWDIDLFNFKLKDISVDSSHLHIEDVAQQYLEVMK